MGGGDHRQSGFNNYGLAGSFTKLAGKHTIKAGYESRMLRINVWEARAAGTFNFTAGMTQGPESGGQQLERGLWVCIFPAGNGQFRQLLPELEERGIAELLPRLLHSGRLAHHPEANVEPGPAVRFRRAAHGAVQPAELVRSVRQGGTLQRARLYQPHRRAAVRRGGRQSQYAVRWGLEQHRSASGAGVPGERKDRDPGGIRAALWTEHDVRPGDGGALRLSRGDYVDHQPGRVHAAQRAEQSLPGRIPAGARVRARCGDCDGQPD